MSQTSAHIRGNEQEGASLSYELGLNIHTARLSGSIICTEGCLWITVEHDIMDYIIRSGESFTPPQGKIAIAMGLPRGSFTHI